MRHPANLDDLDRRIVAALQVDARASFGAVAGVLGETERTVARRADRLLDGGLLRLTAFLDELRTGLGQPVSLRIRVEPGQLDAVCGELAERPDTRAVMAVTGGADVNCELVAADPPTLHRVLSAELPAISGIRSTRTYAVVRHVKSAAQWRLPVLSAPQVKALQQPARASGTSHARPDLAGADLAVVHVLRDNARASYTELGEQLGVTAATAKRRLDRVLSTGAVMLRASVEPALLGLPIEADVWLDVRPDAVEQVARRLAEHPSVSYCGVVAGGYALELILVLPDLAALYAFSTAVIGRESAVRGSEPTLITHTYKRGYLRTG